jgi:zinc/manganese transport system ATP-binding protein
MAAPPTTPPDVSTLPVATPAVSLRGARVSFDERTLWDGLDLDVAPASS